MTRADIAVVVLAILLLPLLYIKFWGNGQHGEQVVIRVANQTSQYYSLYENRTLVIEGVIGKTTIEINNGQVRFVDAPCQNKQCIIAGWLKTDGAIAACLPNGVSIQVIGRSPRFDAINF